MLITCASTRLRFCIQPYLRLSSDHAKRFHHNCLHELCRADRSFRMGTCHFAALLIFLVSFEASKFASYYPSCFVVRVVAVLLNFLLLKFAVPNMKRKSIFLGLLRCGTTQQFHSVMSNRLCRRCHLCTVMKGRSGCSRIFHLGLFFVDP